MHVCLFDIDGTLLNSHGAGRAAMEQTLLREFDCSRPVHGIPTAGRTDRAITRDLFDFYGIEQSDENRRRFHSTYTRQLESALEEVGGVILPGIAELLEQLSLRDDVLLGLLTGNFQRGAEIKLRHFGLQDYFRFGGFGDHHEHRDDVARSVLQLIPEALGTVDHVARVWVIGDTPADVQCGRAIDACCVAVATGVIDRDELLRTCPDHFFDDLSQPHRFIEQLAPAGKS